MLRSCFKSIELDCTHKCRSCLGVVFLGAPVRRSLRSFVPPVSLYFSQRFVTVEGLTLQHAAILILRKDKSIFQATTPSAHFFHKNAVGQNLAAQLYIICINYIQYKNLRLHREPIDLMGFCVVIVM